jgi:hypothetical protein
VVLPRLLRHALIDFCDGFFGVAPNLHASLLPLPHGRRHLGEAFLHRPFFPVLDCLVKMPVDRGQTVRKLR